MSEPTIWRPGGGRAIPNPVGGSVTFSVLGGEFRFRLENAVEAAPAGSFVYVPRGTPHTWQNVGDRPGRMFVVFTPSGMERFFEAFARLDAAGPEVVGPPLASSHPLPSQVRPPRAG